MSSKTENVKKTAGKDTKTTGKAKAKPKVMNTEREIEESVKEIVVKTVKKVAQKTVTEKTIKRIYYYADRYRDITIVVYKYRIDIWADSLNIDKIASAIIMDNGIRNRMLNALRNHSDIAFAKDLMVAIVTNDVKKASLVLHRWVNTNTTNAITLLAKAGIRLRKVIFSINTEGIERTAVIAWLTAILKYFNVNFELKDSMANEITIIRIPILSNNLFGKRKTVFLNTLQVIESYVKSLREMRKRFVITGTKD